MRDKNSAWSLLKRKLWLWYTILFIGVGIIVFLPFVIYRKTLLWNIDGFLQYYAILVKVKQIILSFIKGNGISFWSWDTGLGADVIGNYALVLCDPFCWISVFFSNRFLDIAYSVIIVLKLYFAGLAMLGFLNYHKKNTRICILMAVGYAFCAYGLLALRQEFFLNQLILFPMIIWGVDRVDDKKSPSLLIVSVMLFVAASLYFSYMSALMVILYIVVKYFVEGRGSNAKDFIIRIAKYTIYAIVGGGLALPIILPVLSVLLQASTGSGIDKQIFPTLKELIRFIPSFAGMMTANSGYSIQNINMLVVLLVPAIILIPKKKQISRYMFFICVFCAFFPFAQSILNGFSYSSGRWSYIFAFFFVYAAADVLDYGVKNIFNFILGVKLWFGTIFCISLFGTTIVKALSMKDFFIIILNLFFGVAILYYLTTEQEIFKQDISRNKQETNCHTVANSKIFKQSIPKKVFLITLANIAVIPVVHNSPNLGNDMSIYMSQGEAYEIYESTSLRALNLIQDSDFYRVDTVDHPSNNGGTIREVHTPANICLYWQAPSLSEYLSTLDKKWIKFNKLMTNSAGTYRRMCVYSNDNRTRMDFLLGVKYFLSDNVSQSGYAGYGFTKKDTVNGVDIMQSAYPAGLGYVYDTVMAESDFLQYEPLEREQLLMQCVELSDKDLNNTIVSKADIEKLKTDIFQVPSTLCDIKGNEITGKTFKITSTEKNMTITPLQEVKESEIYLLFRNFKKEPVTVQTAWDLNNSKDDVYTKRNFFANYFSHIAYENFSVYASVKQKNIKKRLANAAGEAQGIRDNQDYMINLGYYDSFNEQISLNLTEIGNYYYDSIELLAVPINSYQEQASKLSQNRFTVTNKTGNNHIWGETNSEKGGMLYLSILYNPGWKIYIDGIKADKIYHVNTAFMGVEVPAGKHEIELVYKPIGYPYTLISFGICVIVTILLESYFRKRKQGDNVQ